MLSCASCSVGRKLPSRRGPSKHTAAFTAPRTAVQQQQPGSRSTRSSVATDALPISQLFTTAVCIAGAWYLSQQEAVAEQDRAEAFDRRPCPACGGSGVTQCFCTKWSDGDVGCSSCNESGWTKCKSCGGGGMAVPIKVSIRKNDLL